MKLALIVSMAGVSLTVGAFPLHGEVAHVETGAANSICQREDSMAKFTVDVHWDFAKSIKGIEASSAHEAELIALRTCAEYNALEDDVRTRRMLSDGFVACADSYEVTVVQ